MTESFDSWEKNGGVRIRGLGCEWEGHRVRVRLPLALRGLGDEVCLPFSFQAGKVKKLEEEKKGDKETVGVEEEEDNLDKERVG